MSVTCPQNEVRVIKIKDEIEEKEEAAEESIFKQKKNQYLADESIF